MKMEAMQKKKMWKVAITHFFLTIIVCAGVVIATGDWQGLWINLMELLQPIAWLLIVIVFNFSDGENWSTTQIVLMQICFYSAIPLWSICFGWLYAKLLNYFQTRKKILKS